MRCFIDSLVDGVSQEEDDLFKGFSPGNFLGFASCGMAWRTHVLL
jgi:hypothetical protein